MAVGGRGVPVGRGAGSLERGDRSAVDPPARLDDDGLAAPGVALQRAQVRGVLDPEGVRRLVLGLRGQEMSRMRTLVAAAACCLLVDQIGCA